MRAAAVPVPVRVTDWGELVALSVKVRVAVRVPVAAGLKVTVAAQVAPAASEEQVLVSVKELALVPEMATLETVRVPVPLLVRVMAWVAAEVFTVVEAKVSEEALMEAV